MPKFSCTVQMGSSFSASSRVSGCSRWPPLWMTRTEERS